MREDDLSALRRIEAMRKRRIDRELAEAGTAHRDAMSAREKADLAKAESDALFFQAKSDMFRNPANEQARVWHAAAQQKNGAATQNAGAMMENEQERRGELTAAARAFRKAEAKGAHLMDMAKKLRSEKARRAEDALTEEQQDMKIQSARSGHARQESR